MRISVDSSITSITGAWPRRAPHSQIRRVPTQIRRLPHDFCRPAGVPFGNEPNRRFPGTSQRGIARLACVRGLQRDQSLVRKCEAIADHCIHFPEHGYVRASTAKLSAGCERQSVCCVFCRGRQRCERCHSGYEQSAVAGHDHDRSDPRCWNRQREGQYSERDYRRCRLFERRNQPIFGFDDHLNNAKRRRTRSGRRAV